MKLKHDLSYNKGEINLQDLQSTIGKSVKNSLWLLEDRLSKVRSGIITNKGIVDSRAVMYAQELAEFASDYSNALETYYFLSELHERDNILINKE